MVSGISSWYQSIRDTLTLFAAVNNVRLSTIAFAGTGVGAGAGAGAPKWRPLQVRHTFPVPSGPMSTQRSLRCVSRTQHCGQPYKSLQPQTWYYYKHLNAANYNPYKTRQPHRRCWTPYFPSQTTHISTLITFIERQPISQIRHSQRFSLFKELGTDLFANRKMRTETVKEMRRVGLLGSQFIQTSIVTKKNQHLIRVFF